MILKVSFNLNNSVILGNANDRVDWSYHSTMCTDGQSRQYSNLPKLHKLTIFSSNLEEKIYSFIRALDLQPVHISLMLSEREQNIDISL